MERVSPKDPRPRDAQRDHHFVVGREALPRRHPGHEQFSSAPEPSKIVERNGRKRDDGVGLDGGPTQADTIAPRGYAHIYEILGVIGVVLGQRPPPQGVFSVKSFKDVRGHGRVQPVGGEEVYLPSA